MFKRVLLLSAMLGLSSILACKTEHDVQVKPIHITIDVNLKVDRALDAYFQDIDKLEAGIGQK